MTAHRQAAFMNATPLPCKATLNARETITESVRLKPAGTRYGPNARRHEARRATALAHAGKATCRKSNSGVWYCGDFILCLLLPVYVTIFLCSRLANFATRLTISFNEDSAHLQRFFNMLPRGQTIFPNMGNIHYTHLPESQNTLALIHSLNRSKAMPNTEQARRVGKSSVYYLHAVSRARLHSWACTRGF